MALTWLEEYPRVHCQPYASGWASTLLAPVLYSNYIIIVGTFFVSLPAHEMLVFLFGLGMTGDLLINAALVELVADPVPIPGCGGPFGLPATLAQHAAFFVSGLMTFKLQRRAPGFGDSALALLAAWLLLVPFAALHFNVASPWQIVSAFALGSSLGTAFMFGVLLHIALAYVPKLLRWRVFTWLGYRHSLDDADTDNDE